MSERSGKVQTVLGLVEPAALGRTLAHEHLLLDICPPENRALPEYEITLGNSGALRRSPKDNPLAQRLTSEEEAIAEVLDFKSAGGGAIVEVTSLGLSRDPEGLRRIARATGVHVVMGCSYYVHNYQPPEVETMSEAEITARIVAEIEQGAEGTGICPGIIGEVGLYWPMHVNEQKVLRASAAAQRQTGAALMIHPGRHPESPLEAIAIIKEAGGDPGRTIMAHMDRTLFAPEDMRALAETGCYLEFDLFGQESSFYPLGPIDMPNDAVRIDHLMRLSREGFRERLLIAHDICYKTRLKKYGGEGYDHLLTNVAPMMERKGVTDAELSAFLVENPARVLTFL